MPRPRAQGPRRSASLASGLSETTEHPRIDFLNNGPLPKPRPHIMSRSLRYRLPLYHRSSYHVLMVFIGGIALLLFIIRIAPWIAGAMHVWAYGSNKFKEKGPWLIALVTDLDRQACRRGVLSHRSSSCPEATSWVSYFKRGVLHSAAVDGKMTVNWIDERQLESRSSVGGRGMELSELEWFAGHLLSPDDRTGILYEIMSPKGNLPKQAKGLLYGPGSSMKPSVLMRATLFDGDGQNEDKFFKAEWMVVKDRALHIGSHGRPTTDPKQGTRIKSKDPLWIKLVRPDFEVSHLNWTKVYSILELAAGTPFPGYLMHECVLWASERREWVFLPRRRSIEPFDPVLNERKGWNKVLIASEDFNSIRVIEIRDLYDATGFRGFSSAKFVPGTRQQVVAALRTMEIDGGNYAQSSRYSETFFSTFSLESGRLLTAEQSVGAKKYEGLVFL